MRIQVLGPIRAWHGDRPIVLGSTGQRAMLGLLALAVGQPLSRAELIDTLWGDRPPPSATNMLQTYVKHLRRLLEPGRRRYAQSAVLPAVGDGYALHLPSEQVDLVCFRELVNAAAVAHRDGDPHRAADLLSQGLGLWQGPPLADVPSLAAHPKVVALAEQRRAAAARLGEVLIAAGDVLAALPVLEQAAADQPLDEVACARLIRAYHAAGRRAQGFATYHATRRRLADELGVDPGPELTAVHAALLRDETPQPGTHGSPADPPAPQPPRRPTPAQLPADTAAFTGRDHHLRQLDALLPDDAGNRATAVVISALSGTAGVGKTALAVHWAHRVRDRFPDGQLYVNLLGFAATGSTMSPAEALRGFLDALGVPAQHMPADLPGRTSLYRSLLADKQMLVVLDNARDAEQVRPLLPGAPGCLVLVTSRNQLSSLVAAEGARPLTLDVLSSTEARQFLTHRLGRRRTAAEPEATDEIITRCARLPLALAIFAARAATHPDFPLAALTRELREARTSLDVLTGDDPTSDVRAVISWSCRTLSAPAARLFRLLGLHRGPDISAPAAASLAGTPALQVRPWLTELTRAHLLTEHTPGRYTFHDLLRAYATELADTYQDMSEHRAALCRLLDHYLHTAHAAARLLEPHRESITPAPCQPGVTPEHLADHRSALAWLTCEHPVLVGAVNQAAGNRYDTHAWQLVAVLHYYFQRRGRWPDWIATAGIALAAAHRLADPAAQADAHRVLASACSHLNRFDEAHAHCRHALARYEELGDRTGQARIHHGIGFTFARQGRFDQALPHVQRAQDLCRATRDHAGQARALNLLGCLQTKMNRHQQALISCQQAIALHQRIDDRIGEATTWDSLGEIHHHLDDYEQAAACYQHALELYPDFDDRYGTASTLTKLGQVRLLAGDPGAAGTTWRSALRILDDLDHLPDAHRDVEKVRGCLRFLDQLQKPPAATPVTAPETPVGRQVTWLIQASHHLPISTEETAAHITAEYLAVVDMAELNKHLANLAGADGLTMRRYQQFSDHTAWFLATGDVPARTGATAWLVEINVDETSELISELNLRPFRDTPEQPVAEL